MKPNQILIDKNLDKAMEIIPHFFSNYNMIFVKGYINGIELKMLVDSGAQKSIMLEKTAILCNLEYLIDKECKGKVAGVNSVKNIIGKIHLVDMQLPVNSDNESKVEISGGFTILENNSLSEKENINVIIGIDLLISYNVILDFNRKKMIINEYEFNFLDKEESDNLF